MNLREVGPRLPLPASSAPGGMPSRGDEEFSLPVAATPSRRASTAPSAAGKPGQAAEPEAARGMAPPAQPDQPQAGAPAATGRAGATGHEIGPASAEDRPRHPDDASASARMAAPADPGATASSGPRTGTADTVPEAADLPAGLAAVPGFAVPIPALEALGAPAASPAVTGAGASALPGSPSTAVGAAAPVMVAGASGVLAAGVPATAIPLAGLPVMGPGALAHAVGGPTGASGAPTGTIVDPRALDAVVAPAAGASDAVPVGGTAGPVAAVEAASATPSDGLRVPTPAALATAAPLVSTGSGAPGAVAPGPVTAPLAVLRADRPLADAAAAVRGDTAPPSILQSVAGQPAAPPPVSASSHGPIPAAPMAVAGPEAFAALVALSAQAGRGAPLDERAEDGPPAVTGLESGPATTPTGGLTALSPLRALESTAVAVPGSVAMPAAPDAGFDDAFGEKVVWIVEQRLTQAEMRVSPEGLGAIEVRLQLEGNKLSAQFSAAHPDVRQALEAGMGRLRDLLGQHGMELADSHVGQQHGGGDRPPARHARSDDADGDRPALVTTLGGLRARGLIDLYA